jgi:hypothetical protein
LLKLTLVLSVIEMEGHRRSSLHVKAILPRIIKIRKRL